MMRYIILRVLTVFLVLYILHLVLNKLSFFQGMLRSFKRRPPKNEHVEYDKEEWEKIKKKLEE